MKNITLQYLKAVASMTANLKPKDMFYHSFEHFVLTEGEPMEFRKISRKYGIGKMRLCFMNAYQLATMHNELTYVEGYATNHIPTLHGWCVDEEGFVVDNTWLYDKNASNRNYIGVRLPTPYIMRVAYERGMYGVIDNVEMGFPLLKEKFDREKLK